MLGADQIDAAETVTVDLAEVELSILDAFDIDDLDFKTDEGADSGDDGIATFESATVSRQADRLRGAQRREVLTKQSRGRDAFQKLRDQLNGDI